MYYFLAIIVCAIWGATFVSSKILLNAGLSPAMVFFLRFLRPTPLLLFALAAQFFLNLQKSLTQSIMNLPSWLSGFKVFTTNLSRIEIE